MPQGRMNFVEAFSAGLRDRLAQEQELAQQKNRAEMLKMEQAKIDMEHEVHAANLALAKEQLKNQVFQQYATGIRKPTMVEPTGVSAQQAEVGPLAMLQNAPQDIQQKFGAMNIPTPPGAEEPLKTTASNIFYSPSKTQYAEVDPALGGYLKMEGISTPKEMQDIELQKMMQTLPFLAAKAGLEQRIKTAGKLTEIQAEGEQKQKEIGLTGEETRKTEGVKAVTQQQLQTQRDAAAAARNLASIEGRHTDANIRAAATKYAADAKTVQDKKTNEKDITSTAHLMALGLAPNTGSSTNIMKARTALGDIGYVPFEADQRKKLQAVNDVNDLMSFMENHIKDMPETKFGAFVQRLSAKIPGTDAYQFEGMVNGRAANISHTHGGEIGRLSDPDVARSMRILVTPGITKKQALERMSMLRLEATNKVANNILGGVTSPAQKVEILESFNLNPSKFGGFTQINVNGQNKLYSNFAKDPETGRWKYLANPETREYKFVTKAPDEE